jgi:hypothetical protein
MRTWLFGLGLLLIGPGLICAQTSATLTVHVTNAAGSPIQGADATAAPTELWGPVIMPSPVTLKTDQSGEALFALWPGIYRISATKPGFEYTVTPSLEVGREDSQQLSLVLAIASVGRGFVLDTPCYGCVTPVPPLAPIEAPPLTVLIELGPPVAPLVLQPRLATKGILRKRKPQHS